MSEQERKELSESIREAIRLADAANRQIILYEINATIDDIQRMQEGWER